MLRFLCILLVVACVCGCTIDPQRNTFKEKYDVYAKIEIDAASITLPLYHDSPETEFYHSQLLLDQYIPIKELEAFADAIIRRMDAKNLSEYHKIQDEIDRLHSLLRGVIHPPRPEVGWAEIWREKKSPISSCSTIPSVMRPIYQAC
ncbi:MAG: hypothetical protein OXD49_11615 [Candidatus Poribacteria bacterium]|nr:hypothetical protein [Candidatus Poribacteria bacterium]